MPKPKKIKLNKTDTEEMDNLQRNKAIARYGVGTAHELHFEAGEHLWRALRELYPEVEGTNARYYEGVITYTPKEGP